MSRTTLKSAVVGSAVNLEFALMPSTRLGGHIVSGHVDGMGRVVSKEQDGRSFRFKFKVPENLAKYIAEKGSICINGVSLTVNQVEGRLFTVNIVPHTLQETIIGNYQAGTKVNLEVDVVARYLERLLQGESAAESRNKKEGISQEFLAKHGFYTA
jgi:riboflavin synthase